MVSGLVRLNKTQNNYTLIKHIGFGCLTFTISQLHAKTFDLRDEWKLHTDTTISMGSTWSLDNPSVTLLFAPDAASIGKNGQSMGANDDNGRLNFSRYDAVSQVVKGLTDLKLTDGTQGAMLSFKYWYDHAYETGTGDFQAFDDRAWPNFAKFKGIEVWDAYLWKDIKFENGQTLNVKLGKQAFNWGKSRFFANGLNAISPIDIAAMNRPGADGKERNIPVEMAYFTYGVNENLTLEGFYQYKFRATVVDGCGTFFQISDFSPDGCSPIVIAVVGDRTTETAIESESFIPRDTNDKPKDGGQYGVVLKQKFPDLNALELGVYYANYHNRALSTDIITVSAAGKENYNTARYYGVHSEDVQMFGLSLTGKIGSTAYFSELSHKRNQPLAFTGSDLVQYMILASNTPFTEPGVKPDFNQHFEGYARLPVTQFSLGAANSIANVLGSNNLAWSGEFAINHIADINGQRLGRASSFGRTELSTGPYDPATGANACIAQNSGNLSSDQIADLNQKYCNAKDGIYTTWSYGYRLRGALNYDDLFRDTVLMPSLTFRHDIDGFGPNFQKGQMAAGLVVSAVYQKKYTAEIAYQRFFGNNEFSTIDDRDYASLAFKMNF